MNRRKSSKRKSSGLGEPAANRLEQAAGGERRAFLPAALCNALAQRLAGGAYNPRRSAPMNRRKSSKRKSSGLGEPAANRLEQTAGGEQRAFLPAGFMRCVGAAVSGWSLQPKVRRAHEQRKTKQMKKQPVGRTGCKQAGTNGGRGSEGRSFPPVLCDAVARRLAGGAYKPKCSTPMNRGKPSKRKKQPIERTGCKQAGTNGGRGAQGRSFPPVLMRCVDAAVSGRSLQTEAQHAHEQEKTKQTQKAAGQENRLQTGRNKRREGSARRSFPRLYAMRWRSG